jgi:hypothetical protein
MRHLREFVLTGVLMLLCQAASDAQHVAPPNTASTTSITAADIRYHLHWLASDELEGRGTGTEALNVAAQYIANEFKRYGLKPGGDSGSWFQSFEVITGAEAGRSNRLVLTAGGNVRTAVMGTDFTPLGFSSSGTASGKIVFVGYGIKAPRNNWNDYETVDVKGAIVLVASGYPGSDSSLERFSSLRSKAMTAREAGAVAMLVFNPGVDRLHAVQYDGTAASAGIPVISIRHNLVDFIGHASNIDIRKSLPGTGQDSKHVSSIIADVDIQLTSEINYVKRITKNVVAMLPGTEVPDQYYIIGAHYDHLGWGQDGSLYRGDKPMIHHGADDNASGVSGMLELAQYFAAHPLRHSVLFMAFTGEEMGVYGSSHWVNHPTVPLADVNVMFNLDMIGRLNDSTSRLNVQGTGSSPVWNSVARAANSDYSFDLSLIADGQGASDQSAFYMKDIPVLFFFTGLHTDYHRPGDTYDKINYPGEEKVTRYISGIVSMTDTLRTKPAFVRVASTAPQRGRGFNVYVGTIPEFGSTAEGFKISGTSPGSPAEKAGLQSGDIIIEFGASKVLSIYDYMNALSLHKPGEDVPVKVKRGDGIVTVTVHLVPKN